MLTPGSTYKWTENSSPLGIVVTRASYDWSDNADESRKVRYPYLARTVD